MFAVVLAPLLWILCLPLFHGGQYEPPPTPESDEVLLDGVVVQPGFGPVLEFDPDSWEWWFDFNHEGLIDLRARMAERSGSATWPYEPPTSRHRNQVVIPAATEALKDRNRDVRAAAAMALGRMAQRGTLEPVVAMARSDRDLFVRTQAILALGYSRDPAVVETLVELFREAPDKETQSYAIVALGLVGDDGGLEVLRDALGARSLREAGNQVRAAVVYAVGLSGQPDLGQLLIDLLETRYLDSEPQLRATLAVALGRLGDRRWLPAVLALLGDGDSQVRRSAAMAIEALAPILVEDDIPGLLDHYRDAKNGSVRFALLRALGRARQPAARKFLRAEFAGGRYRYRPHLALALAFDGHPGNVPLLLEALEREQEPSQQGAVAVALGLMAARSAAEPLMEMLREDGTPRVQGYVALALGLIDAGDPELPGLLAELIEGTHDPEVVRLAIIALGLINARDRIETLGRSLLTDPPGAIDTAARLYGLGLAGDRSTLPILLRSATDPESLTYIRAYGFQALADLCDPRPVGPAWQLSRHVDMTHEVGFLFELYRSF